MGWRQAWQASPGPQSWRDAGVLMLKGAAMGTADVVPGVSGGTVAFITGIYDQLLCAISSFDLSTLGRLLRGKFTETLAGLHLRFLLALGLGIATAIISTASLANAPPRAALSSAGKTRRGSKLDIFDQGATPSRQDTAPRNYCANYCSRTSDSKHSSNEPYAVRR